MIRLAGAGYAYPGGARVGPVDLVVRPGERVLLTGPTGCGKSTLLRLAAGLAQRHGHGQVAGTVRVGGRDPAALEAAERVRALGFVGQDPDDQVITGSAAAEVAFGPENAGFSPAAVADAVAVGLGRVGLGGLGARAPAALSGGQRQRLVIAAALAGGARALLLDEPLAQLDPDGAVEILDLLGRLAAEGVAVLLVEHRLELVMPAVDRVVVMAEGAVVADPLDHPSRLAALGLRPPARAALAARVGPGPWRARPGDREAAPAPPGAPLLGAEGVDVRWPGGAEALVGVSVGVGAGERLALVGANGAGKSTLLQVLARRLRPTAGRVGGVPTGAVVDVPQNPDLALFSPTVAEELAYGPTERRLGGVEARVREAAAALSVADLLDRPPQALSRGQRLRVAVAAALACAPRVLLLDEPTSGQDGDQVDRMMEGLAAAFGEGAVVFASHDLDVVLRHATRVVVLDGGRVWADGPPLPTLARAAAAGLPLRLPPLAEVCLAHGLPYLPVERLAERLEPA